MSAAPRFPSPASRLRIARAQDPVGSRRSRTAFLCLALSGLATCLIGCAAPFCGAPCEAGAAAAARPVLPPENHYGTRFGHLDTWHMSLAQLLAERAELESLLAADAGDSVLLEALDDRKGGEESWIYDGFQAGGSRFRANGKLRREVGVEDIAKRVMRGIEESPRRDLFERYRVVRLQLLSLQSAPAEPPDSADAAARPASVGEPAENASGRHAEGPAAPEDPLPDSAGAAASAQAGESLWSGSYRADGGLSKAVPEGFAGLEECQDWAQRKADEYRREAFAFEYECRRDGKAFKRKMW